MTSGRWWRYCSLILFSLPVFLSITVFFFNDTATTEIYTLSLHDALPICNIPCLGEPLPPGEAQELVDDQRMRVDQLGGAATGMKALCQDGLGMSQGLTIKQEGLWAVSKLALQGFKVKQFRIMIEGH